jgi:hypothetical protein
LEVGITGRPSKDHSTKVWLQLAPWFLRRRLKCEMLTDRRWTKCDGNSSHGLKARWAKKHYKANFCFDFDNYATCINKTRIKCSFIT